MKKILVSVVLVLSLFALSAAAADSWTGWISDSKCGAKGAKAEHKKCAEACVKGGLAPVLVADGKVLKIDNPDKVEGHIGDHVTVTGTVTGDSVHVDSVAAAQ